MRLARPFGSFVVLAAAVLALAPSPSRADLPDGPGAARAYAFFEIFCVDQMPGLVRLRDIASAGGFPEIVGDELQAYAPEIPPDELWAWRFGDLGHEYVLVGARGRPDDRFAADVPAFARSALSSCSVIMPKEAFDWPVLDVVLQKRDRRADETWQQGPFEVHSWSGATDTLLIWIQWYRPITPTVRGVLTIGGAVKERDG